MHAADRLPLFPLPLVLFPGALLPLHIFEPRYRALLADVRAGDGRFGIVLTTGEPGRALAPGHVGCVALVREVETLPDGRSNILVQGTDRFALERLVEEPGAPPYQVGEVRPVHDEPVRDPDALRAAAERARVAFVRVARAARILADEPAAAVPPLPDDDTHLAFAVAAAVDLELDTRQAILASRDAVARTDRVAELLERAAPDLEARAIIHAAARANGQGPDLPSTGTDA